jgi:CheY-like chemotaxis protein
VGVGSGSTLIKTIRMGEAEINDLLDRLDEADQVGKANNKEQDSCSFRLAHCVVHMQQPGAFSSTPFVAATRKLHRKGLSFIHGGFVHQDTRCYLQLVNRRGVWKDLEARATQCRYVEKSLYEISLEFAEPINVADFCERASRIKVLLAEDDASTARLAKHMLTQLNAEVDHVSNGQEAIDRATSNRYDCMLMDIEMEPVDGLDATKQLRASGYTGVIVACTALNGDDDRQRFDQAGFNRLITKPFRKSDLSQLADWIKREPLISTLQDDPSLAELIDGFVQDLHDQTAWLQRKLEEGDIEALGRLARQLKGSAGSFGFEPISEAAAALEAGVAASLPASELGDIVQRLIDLGIRAQTSESASH